MGKTITSLPLQRQVQEQFQLFLPAHITASKDKVSSLVVLVSLCNLHNTMEIYTTRISTILMLRFPKNTSNIPKMRGHLVVLWACQVSNHARSGNTSTDWLLPGFSGRVLSSRLDSQLAHLLLIGSRLVFRLWIEFLRVPLLLRDAICSDS
ncbi:hypothetical protein AQUCO_04100019v1 [Aquilegia coerulea]|uniref:Uncharacterized protein n=1 Tax=Aquilegia coerulea TaxID=218851 RepID=A0A2G5CR31_AQUCA|nr:hypothetical protein AQUCO_04100019v1 [Aquilegia coerulea]